MWAIRVSLTGAVESYLFDCILQSNIDKKTQRSDGLYLCVSSTRHTRKILFHTRHIEGSCVWWQVDAEELLLSMGTQNYTSNIEDWVANPEGYSLKDPVLDHTTVMLLLSAMIKQRSHMSSLCLLSENWSYYKFQYTIQIWCNTQCFPKSSMTPLLQFTIPSRINDTLLGWLKYLLRALP